MRSLAAAVAVVATAALLLLTRSSHAEPPRPEETRKLADVIAAVAKEKGKRPALASLRWYAEVNGVEQLSVPVGSTPTSLGQWGDNHAELGAIGALAACKPMDAAAKTAALALLKEFGDDLAPPLRAAALAEAGKPDDAVALFTQWGTSHLGDGPCPGEHPMYSHRRVGHVGAALACVETLAPKSPAVARLKKVLERAKACAANNHAVG